ncbi:MAG: LPS assembly lipoprotein LptE [Myxococcota bacterium]
MRRSRLVFLLCVLALLQGACGYSFVRYGGGLGDIRRVAIRGLTNDTFEPGVEALVSEALTREFRQRGALRLVDDPVAADLVIGGAVKRIEMRRRSFSSVLFALEYEVRMELDLAIEMRDGTTVAIDPNALAESERYLASSDVEVTRTNRQEALRRLSGLLAARVHDALYERVAP